MPATLDLKFLYYFSNAENEVFEVKITNLPEGTPIGHIYHWLYYDHKHFLKLGFKSMSADDKKEYRSFDQGELQFDKTQAQLTLGSQETGLTVHNIHSIPTERIEQIHNFLSQYLTAQK